MATAFPIQPIQRFGGQSEAVKRPKEFAYFSYDEDHQFRLDDSSLKWYYPPALGVDLSSGFEDFKSHSDSVDEHLDSLLKTIANHEKETGKPIDAQVVTWRGMMTKIMTVPFDDRDGFEMNATLYRDCIFIEENHAWKQHQKKEQSNQKWKNPIPQEVMTFWGYKFEALSTLPLPWGQTSRQHIESRPTHPVTNAAQYCSVVRTGFGPTTLCLGGEVDCLWDGTKPPTPGAPIGWVELKTSIDVRSDRDALNFERKLLKYWAQSFLLGVPRIVVGFRSRDGVLVRVEEMETAGIPARVAGRRPRPLWDGDVCINFASAFLEWLRATITDEGVWRIRRQQGAAEIEAFQVEEVGHGEIVSDEFMNHRIKLEMRATQVGSGEVMAGKEAVGHGEIVSDEFMNHRSKMEMRARQQGSGEAEKEVVEPEAQPATATGA
ncbi:RAI1 like PD-XK nuclease-domain-containing protein [Schizothecium vesticola]|uniref:Decapping nuclease n=1 Tax=Schizothecium vesticola TaxID=314040 RepID=A0AA40FC24_9PEZI|nr:RAI1 like PD-XK nuclease-domain-containing protein [Schizothecium vesticola]